MLARAAIVDQELGSLSSSELKLELSEIVPFAFM